MLYRYTGVNESHNGIDDNNNKDRTKAIAAAIPMAGIIVAASLLSGLSLLNSYQPALAQQNMTSNATTTTTSPTTTGGGTVQSLLVLQHKSAQAAPRTPPLTQQQQAMAVLMQRQVTLLWPQMPLPSRMLLLLEEVINRLQR